MTHLRRGPVYTALAGLLVGLIAGPLGPVVLLGVLPLAPPGGDRQGVRTEGDRAASGVDHEQFFLDPDRSHVPMVASSPGRRWLDPPVPLHRGQRLHRTVIPNIGAGFCGDLRPPLLLVTLRTRPQVPRLLSWRPEGADRPTMAGDHKFRARFCWG